MCSNLSEYFPQKNRYGTNKKEELKDLPVVANFATTARDGKTYKMEFYNLEMILSIGYRVKSQSGIRFRIWANKTSLPPVEGIFFDGQLFDAYKFAADLIRSARKSIVLIDNYIDENVLMLFTKRSPGVTNWHIITLPRFYYEILFLYLLKNFQTKQGI
ncbi:RhuM family protein [Parabacteroides goldsteinii]|uniref:RhuM family protein n=1 Tax=Parabacteroides goldsteinii TaxID=328812 RepID=UPI003F93556A